MADILATQTGNWSAGATWVGGVPPGVSDNAMANNYTVTIDQDVTCVSVRTDTTGGATASGQFTLGNGITLTANVVSGGGYCLVSVTSGTVVGNIAAGSSPGAYGLWFNSVGTVAIIGNITGGSATTTYGIFVNNSGTLNITGNATGGTNGTGYGMYLASAPTVALTGTAIASIQTAAIVNLGSADLSVQSLQWASNGMGPINGIM